MSELKFGWHMHSFPVDGSSGSDFVQQIDKALTIIEPRYDSVWLDDHVIPWAQFQSKDTPFLECLTTLAHFATKYTEIDFGTSVICQAYRNPALMAKMAANLQLLMNGRLLFGIGAGWLEEEYHAYNWEFPKPSIRIAQMVEAIQIAKKLWTESPASFEGEYYRIENAYCEPRPDPIPPILIGGGGEQLTLRAVAQHADMWNIPAAPLDVYAHKLDVLRKHCDDVGRDFDEIILTWSCEATAVAQTEAEAKRIIEASPYGQRNPVYGTPEQVAEKLQQYVDLGVEHIIVRILDFPRTDGIQMFAEEVMPLMRK